MAGKDRAHRLCVTPIIGLLLLVANRLAHFVQKAKWLGGRAGGMFLPIGLRILLQISRRMYIAFLSNSHSKDCKHYKNYQLTRPDYLN